MCNQNNTCVPSISYSVTNTPLYEVSLGTFTAGTSFFWAFDVPVRTSRAYLMLNGVTKLLDTGAVSKTSECSCLSSLLPAACDCATLYLADSAVEGFVGYDLSSNGNTNGFGLADIRPGVGTCGINGDKDIADASYTIFSTNYTMSGEIPPILTDGEIKLYLESSICIPPSAQVSFAFGCEPVLPI
jgi:hypothetical protein